MIPTLVRLTSLTSTVIPSNVTENGLCARRDSLSAVGNHCCSDGVTPWVYSKQFLLSLLRLRLTLDDCNSLSTIFIYDAELAVAVSDVNAFERRLLLTHDTISLSSMERRVKNLLVINTSPILLTVLCPVSTIPLPFFSCRFAVPVSRCRFRTPLPLHAVAYLFAVYGCNGTEFSYVIFTEQRNFITAER